MKAIMEWLRQRMDRRARRLSKREQAIYHSVVMVMLEQGRPPEPAIEAAHMVAGWSRRFPKAD